MGPPIAVAPCVAAGAPVRALAARWAQLGVLGRQLASGLLGGCWGLCWLGWRAVAQVHHVVRAYGQGQHAQVGVLGVLRPAHAQQLQVRGQQGVGAHLGAAHRGGGAVALLPAHQHGHQRGPAFDRVARLRRSSRVIRVVPPVLLRLYSLASAGLLFTSLAA